MLATRYHGDRDIRVDEVPELALREPTDALVRVHLAGICGSDLHFYRPGSSLGFGAEERVGHEFVGEVLEVGAEVRSVRAGQAVVSSPSIADGTCEMCRERCTTPASAASASSGTRARSGTTAARWRAASPRSSACPSPTPPSCRFPRS